MQPTTVVAREMLGFGGMVAGIAGAYALWRSYRRKNTIVGFQHCNHEIMDYLENRTKENVARVRACKAAIRVMGLTEVEARDPIKLERPY